MARLIPGDASLVATRLLVLLIWSVIPLCWLYTILFSARALHLYPSSPASIGLHLERFFSSRLVLIYTSVEVLFYIYQLHLKRLVQRPGPRPTYGRRFLRFVFSQALDGGLHKNNAIDHATTTRSSNASNGSAYNLRKRSAAPAPMATIPAGEATSDKPSSRPFPSAIQPTDDLPEDVGKVERLRRLRAVSYVPAFVDDNLQRSDPRAKAFSDEYRQWFWNVPVEALTRRDVEHWLSWALYGAHLEEIEQEHKGSHKTQEADNGVPPRNFASPIPPEWKDAAQGGARPAMPKRRMSAFAEEDIRGTRAKEGEWEDPVRGNRLDFLHYCRELMEARQGFSLPEKPHPDYIHLRIKVSSGPEIRTMRLTLDPVRVVPRPLAIYCATNFLTFLATKKAQRSGFKMERRGRLSYLIYRPPGWTPAKAIKEDSPHSRPVLFLHGLGIGLSQYIEVINFLIEDPELSSRPILIPIQEWISQAIFSRNFLEPMTHHETTATLRQVFRSEGWDHERCGFDVLAHSWGTIFASWVLKSFPGLARRTCLVGEYLFARVWCAQADRATHHRSGLLQAVGAGCMRQLSLRELHFRTRGAARALTMSRTLADPGNDANAHHLALLCGERSRHGKQPRAAFRLVFVSALARRDPTHRLATPHADLACLGRRNSVSQGDVRVSAGPRHARGEGRRRPLLRRGLRTRRAAHEARAGDGEGPEVAQGRIAE